MLADEEMEVEVVAYILVFQKVIYLKVRERQGSVQIKHTKPKTQKRLASFFSSLCYQQL